MIAPEKSDINYQKPKNWLLPLTGEKLFLKRSDIMNWPGCQSTFTPQQLTRTFTRSLAFEFLSKKLIHEKAQKQATE